MIDYYELKQVLELIRPKTLNIGFESVFKISKNEFNKIVKLLPDHLTKTQKQELVNLFEILLDRSNINSSNKRELREFNLSQTKIKNFIKLLKGKC